MAGIFGDDINSRKDFFRALSEAQRKVSDALKRMPRDGTLQSTKLQLDAVANWTANGRTPTPEERESTDMGLRMYREFETTDDVELYELRNLIGGINNYFRHWPDDANAADPDYWP
jgi:hypothetical protein